MAGEQLTNKALLDASPAQQKSFISNATVMAGLIAAQNKPGQAECIDSWYAKNEKNNFSPILDTMKRLPNYHPNAVLLAMLEKSCGELKYTARSAALQ